MKLYDKKDLETGKKIIRALDNNLRQEILDFIDEQKTTTVQPIYQKLRIEQAVCSVHLKTLRDANIVNCTRQGKEMHYSINTVYLDKVNKLIRNLAELAE